MPWTVEGNDQNPWTQLDPPWWYNIRFKTTLVVSRPTIIHLMLSSDHYVSLLINAKETDAKETGGGTDEVHARWTWALNWTRRREAWATWRSWWRAVARCTRAPPCRVVHETICTLNGAGSGQAAAASPGRQLAATSDLLVVLHTECSLVYPVLQKIKRWTSQMRW